MGKHLSNTQTGLQIAPSETFGREAPEELIDQSQAEYFEIERYIPPAIHPNREGKLKQRFHLDALNAHQKETRNAKAKNSKRYKISRIQN